MPLDLTARLVQRPINANEEFNDDGMASQGPPSQPVPRSEQQMEDKCSVRDGGGDAQWHSFPISSWNVAGMSAADVAAILSREAAAEITALQEYPKSRTLGWKKIVSDDVEMHIHSSGEMWGLLSIPASGCCCSAKRALEAAGCS